MGLGKEKRDIFGAVREELPGGVHFWMAPNCSVSVQIKFLYKVKLEEN